MTATEYNKATRPIANSEKLDKFTSWVRICGIYSHRKVIWGVVPEANSRLYKSCKVKDLRII